MNQVQTWRETAAAPVAAPAPPSDTMRRLQIGIAGLLAVLLLVGLAGLIGDRARENAAKDAATAIEVKMPGPQPKPASAPLEELGVQPVSKDENEDMSVKVPQPTPTVPDLEPDPELQRARQSKGQ
ncbi:hypothetical protein [Sphingopyxis indica]|uniref:Uncharacterized protein n=1 Tax=Sphingopyxis indica TaxID=436663 RepID=A0A239FYB3_9SPHN|nr:hypothetical protein [Sphingopyxis indica]SNS62037.1 hypothetical protein SAMN06295955_102309 [Sphingopyxis indica]